MYSGLGRWPASSSWRCVGIDMGGSGMDGGIGDAGRTSGSSFRAGAGLLSAPAGKLLWPSILSGAGRGKGWYELRRVDAPLEGGWLVDFRRFIGGVETVLVERLGRPWAPCELKVAVVDPDVVFSLEWSTARDSPR